MPELPEVHTFQHYFNETALHQRIVDVPIQDDRIIRNMDGNSFRKALKGRTFLGSYRRGKYLFARLDNEHRVLLHFGMSGDLKYYSDPEDKPKHERFAFHFDNDMRLGFDCPRLFARILYLTDYEAYIAQIGLGPDAMVITEAEFLKAMEGRTGTIKGFLLNQKVLAGMGNLYADQVCYQTRIHPASRIDKLSKPKRKLIYRTMQDILKDATERLPYYKGYPENWFWQTWRTDGTPGPEGKGVVVHEPIAGRTTYYVKGWQKKY